jgi:hypothetical protein
MVPRARQGEAGTEKAEMLTSEAAGRSVLKGAKRRAD